MYKIRNGAFETNSSSGDYYDDYDDVKESVTVDQDVEINLFFRENITKDQKNIFMEEVICESYFTEQVAELFAEFFSSETCPLEYYDYEEDNDYITLYYGIEEIEVSVSWDGKYYPATRYSPAEYPEPIAEDYECVVDNARILKIEKFIYLLLEKYHHKDDIIKIEIIVEDIDDKIDNALDDL